MKDGWQCCFQDDGTVNNRSWYLCLVTIKKCLSLSTADILSSFLVRKKSCQYQVSCEQPLQVSSELNNGVVDQPLLQTSFFPFNGILLPALQKLCPSVRNNSDERYSDQD